MPPKNQNQFQPNANNIPPGAENHPLFRPTVISPTPTAPAQTPPPQQANGFEMPTVPPVLLSNSMPQGMSGYNSPPDTSKKRFGMKKTLLFIVLPALLLLGGSAAAAYYGYVVPNKPENLWASSLERTGKAYDEMVKFVDTTAQKDNVEYKGDFKISGALAADGSMSGSSSKNGSRLTGDISASGIKVNFDVRAINSERSTPDIYFKATGLEGLGNLFGFADPVYTTALNGINNQWYVVDHTLFDQYTDSTNTDVQLGMDDVNELLKAIGESSKQYVFTKDASKTVVTVKQNVGKETQDGRGVYHYKVGVNKENLKKYNNDLCDRLAKTSIYKLINDSALGGSGSECKDVADIDKLTNDGSADVWVDTKTKLVHKVRFTEKDDQSNILDIFQDYQGGDEIPLGLTSSGKDTNTTLKLKLNRATNVVDLNLTSKGTGADEYNAEFNFTVKPSDTEVKVETPEGAKNIITLLSDLGFGEIISGTYSDVQQASKDTERKTDINAIASHLEAYNAQNGYYPTLAQVNDPAWRSQNMKGLDVEALKDPDETEAKLSDSADTTGYYYQTDPAGCGAVDAPACATYLLSALLSDGSEYSKESLN